MFLIKILQIFSIRFSHAGVRLHRIFKFVEREVRIYLRGGERGMTRNSFTASSDAPSLSMDVAKVWRSTCGLFRIADDPERAFLTMSYRVFCLLLRLRLRAGAGCR